MGGVGEQCSVDDVGQSPLEDADLFGVGVTLGLSALEELACRRVLALLGPAKPGRSSQVCGFRVGFRLRGRLFG